MNDYLFLQVSHAWHMFYNHQEWLLRLHFCCYGDHNMQLYLDAHWSQHQLKKNCKLKVTTVIYWKSSLGYYIDTFFGPYFHFCLELALETWAKALLTHSLWVHDPNHTHSLADFQWSGLFDQRTLRLTENCLQIQKWCPYRGRGVVSAPICANMVSSQYWPRLFYKAAAMCTACHDYTRPLPPILAQNLQNRLHQLITCRRSQKASLVVKGLKGILTSYANLKTMLIVSVAQT